MIGLSLAITGVAERRRPGVVPPALSWAYRGASANTTSTTTTITCTLPETAQAGDLIVMVTSNSQDINGSDLPFQLGANGTQSSRKRFTVASGGETSVSMTFASAANHRAIALMFRPSGGEINAEAAYYRLGNPPAATALAISTRPALAVFCGSYNGSSTAAASSVILPAGFQIVLDQPSSGTFRGLYVGYSIFTGSETTTGNFRMFYGNATMNVGRVFELAAP